MREMCEFFDFCGCFGIGSALQIACFAQSICVVFKVLQIIFGFIFRIGFRRPYRMYFGILRNRLRKIVIPAYKRITRSARSGRLGGKTIFFYLLRLDFRITVRIKRNRVHRSPTNRNHESIRNLVVKRFKNVKNVIARRKRRSIG